MSSSYFRSSVAWVTKVASAWLVHTVEHQSLTTQFLAVAFLRLAFIFSQPHDDISTKTETPAMRRRCKIWKNGIIWHDANGVSTLFEVRDLRSIVLSMSCMEDCRIHCVRLCSQLIQTILNQKVNFVQECSLKSSYIVDVAGESHLQAVDGCPSHSINYLINYLSSRISTKRANGNPDLTLINTDGSQGQQISEVLYFEPYALLIWGLIKKTV